MKAEFPNIEVVLSVVYRKLERNEWSENKKGEKQERRVGEKLTELTQQNLKADDKVITKWC